MIISFTVLGKKKGEINCYQIANLGSTWRRFNCSLTDEDHNQEWPVDHNMEEGYLVLAHKALAVIRQNAKRKTTQSKGDIVL